jgi:hypothetical protein
MAGLIYKIRSGQRLNPKPGGFGVPYFSTCVCVCVDLGLKKNLADACGQSTHQPQLYRWRRGDVGRLYGQFISNIDWNGRLY